MSSSGKWIIVLTIILITIVQAFIWYVSFVNAGNGSALNFVSFAGTLISIILAVLAIGYTYGESLNQKGKSDSLSIQIASLTDVTNSIRVQADAISEVSNIKTELEGVAQRIENGFLETKQNVSSVSSAIDGVNRRFDEINLTRSTPFIPSGLDKAEAARSLLAARTPLMEISVLIIAYLSDVKEIYITSGECDEELTEIIKSLIQEGHKVFQSETESLKLFTGSVLSSIAILEGFGLLTREPKDDDIKTTDEEADDRTQGRKIAKIDSLLRKELIQTVVTKPMKSGPFYTAMRDLVISRLCDHPLWDI